MDNNQLTNKLDNKLASNIDKKLTKKNWLFIQYLNNGLSVTEAYKLAGYKGTHPNQPYLLNYELKQKISEIAINSGFNKEKLMIELNRLIEIPLDDSKKSVTFREKLASLKFLASLLPEAKRTQQTFSHFVIYNGTVKSVDNQQVIDVKPIETTENQQV